MTDLISIIIPAYNIEGYIDQCIESVMNQSYSDIEIIIVNDGSIDHTGEICQKFADIDTRIVYISQENRGLVGARKTGLNNTKGKYVIFVDGDDYIDKDLVEKLYKIMLENDVDFVHSNYMIDGKNMNHIKKVHKYTVEDLNWDFKVQLLKNHVFEWDMRKDIFECNLYGCIYKKSFIRECYESIPDYQQYGEDLLCFCNQIMKCKSMMLIPDAYYHYVMRDGSLDHPRGFEDAVENKISLYKEIKKMLDSYKVLPVLSDKCQLFFARKMLYDFRMITSEGIKIENNYKCEFIEMLYGKKIVLYGAGCVGQNIYEQLMKFQNIEIVEWVDSNYYKIYNQYRIINNPKMIDSLDYDYIVIAVEREDVADEIIEKLMRVGVSRCKILWQSFSKSFSVLIK